MNDERRVKAEIMNIFDAAQKENAASDVVSSEYATKEDVDKFVAKLETNNEKTQNRADNILSRLRSGVISQDVAKKQMKNLLNDSLAVAMGTLLKFRGVPNNITVTEEQIQKAIETVNQKLS